MAKFALSSILLLSMLCSANIDDANCPQKCQTEQVTAYFRALDKVFQEGSTTADVNALFSILHERVRYVHTKYEADFQREAWRTAFIGNLERGAYLNGPEQQIGILTMLHGKDAVAVEYSHGRVLPDGAWSSSEPLLALFRFADGRISLIEELW